MTVSTIEIPFKVKLSISGNTVVADAKVALACFGSVFPIRFLNLEWLNDNVRITMGSQYIDHKSVRVTNSTYKVTLKYTVCCKTGGSTTSFYVDVITKARGTRDAKAKLMDWIPETSYSSRMKDKSMISTYEIIDFDAAAAIESHKIYEEKL